MSERMYDLYRVQLNPKTGEPTGQEFKVGGDKWVPMTHQEACTAKRKFGHHRHCRFELREVVTQ